MEPLLGWIMLIPFALWFVVKEIPKLMQIIKQPDKDNDIEIGGNDNIKREFHDYM